MRLLLAEPVKTAFVESLPTLAGLSVGYGPGRGVAGETAAALAPEGRVHRAENLARNAAVIGAPFGGLVAMGLARKYRAPSRVGNFISKNFPEGIIAEPEIEQELIRLGVPGVAAIGGSLAGGAATGALAGGAHQLAGATAHRRKEASLKPSPMWGTIGGASRQPAWRAQAGFTPTGMNTASQRLQKSMSMGKFDRDKGLKPLDLGKMQRDAQAAATSVKMGHVMDVLTKLALEEPAEEKKPATKVPGALALGVGGQALSSGAGAGVGLSQPLMQRRWGEEAAGEGAVDLAKKVVGTSPVPVYHNPMGPHDGQFLYGEEGSLTPERRQTRVGITGKAAPSLIAHEIGHAEIDRNRFGRLLQNKPVAYLSHYRGPLSLGLGLATGGSDDERVRNGGLIAAGLMSAPQLGYEGAANIMGYRKLQQLGANPEQLRLARRAMIPAMGSYAGLAAMHMGTAMVGSGVARGIANIKRKNSPAEQPKTAAEVMPRSEREDEETGDELEPEIAKAANIDLGGQEGFSTNMYSGQMNPGTLPYASSVPNWREAPVKTVNGADAPQKTAELVDHKDIPDEAITYSPRERVEGRREGIGGTIGMLGGAAAGAYGAHKLKADPVGVLLGAGGGALLGGFTGSGLTHGVNRLTRSPEEEQEVADRQALRAHWDGVKTAQPGLTPLSRLNSSKMIGAPRATPAPGPSIAQISKPKGYGTPMSGAKKGNNII